MCRGAPTRARRGRSWLTSVPRAESPTANTRRACAPAPLTPCTHCPQRAPGEDFLIFDAHGVPGGAPLFAPPGAPVTLPLDEHSAHYRGAVAASWMGSHHLWLSVPAVPPADGPPERRLSRWEARRGLRGAPQVASKMRVVHFATARQHRVYDSGLPPAAPAAFPWPRQRELAVVLYASWLKVPSTLCDDPASAATLDRLKA